MIISASRRTDIPSYYSKWFFNRIKAGFVYVRNPMNIHQISCISLKPDVVDGIVFWTKNPQPMIENLDLISDYNYYFQFTLNSYGKDIESNVPSKNNNVIPTFKRLSSEIGAKRVLWRYDPIFLNEKYDMDYHIKYFEQLCNQLSGHTEKCTISFLDYYKNIQKNINSLSIVTPTFDQIIEISEKFSVIGKNNGIKIETCAEKYNLSKYGIEQACCIDKSRFELISGCKFEVDKDSNQREECGCVTSIDIGAYNTCNNGCKYCYANYSQNVVKRNFLAHDPLSPLLFGNLQDNDTINERKMISCIKSQLDLFE